MKYERLVNASTPDGSVFIFRIEADNYWWSVYKNGMTKNGRRVIKGFRACFTNADGERCSNRDSTRKGAIRDAIVNNLLSYGVSYGDAVHAEYELIKE